jgi:hypothetical protein
MDDTLPVVKKRRIDLSAGVDYNLIPKKKVEFISHCQFILRALARKKKGGETSITILLYFSCSPSFVDANPSITAFHRQ